MKFAQKTFWPAALHCTKFLFFSAKFQNETTPPQLGVLDSLTIWRHSAYVIPPPFPLLGCPLNMSTVLLCRVNLDNWNQIIPYKICKVSTSSPIIHGLVRRSHRVSAAAFQGLSGTNPFPSHETIAPRGLWRDVLFGGLRNCSELGSLKPYPIGTFYAACPIHVLCIV